MIAEKVAFGGDRRERALSAALSAHYRSLFRRQWQLAPEPPHFYDHRIDLHALAAGGGVPFSWFRAFFAAQLMRSGDRVLDIGCGDGLFAARFFAQRVAQVDALDIEPSAIEHAKRYNAAPNVSYHLLDAVEQPFPADRYDVVVWDGAIGHFPRETTGRVLEKVASALAPDGAFAGSESLGQEGHDHLQFFADLGALRKVLAPHFPQLGLTEIEYKIPAGLMRREAFWRAAADPARIDAAGWS
jgi:2-polyprenyl-3-methyl-5-hydroxy-6-metoxy-1,4-benzoquinol methylase